MTRRRIHAAFTHEETARIIGIPKATVSRLQSLGLEPEELGGKWSARQVLGLACKVHARRAGATQAASDAGFHYLSSSGWQGLRINRIGVGCFLRMVGDYCDNELTDETTAFDPAKIRAAADASIPYVVFDVSRWVRRIENEVTEHRRASDNENARRRTAAVASEGQSA